MPAISSPKPNGIPSGGTIPRRGLSPKPKQNLDAALSATLRGRQPLRRAEALDFDDSTVDLTDRVFALEFIFRDGALPPCP